MALMLSSLAISQEASTPGKYGRVSIIPRLEVNPWLGNGNGNKSGSSFGNSSLYTLFEGSLSEHFSWTIANHWLRAEESYLLYKNIGRSDDVNFLDYFKLDFTFNNWTISVGKDMILTGGFEFDNWDWDIHTAFASELWNSLPSYQWGGSVGYTNNSENTTLTLQMTTSPFGEKPLKSKLFSYSGQWRGEYGAFSNIWSVTAMEYTSGKYDWVVSLGQRVSIGDFYVGLDWTNKLAYYDSEVGFAKGHNFLGTIGYNAPSEKFDVSLMGGLMNPRRCYTEDECGDECACTENYWNGGAIFQYYPLNNRDMMRLHATANYNSLMERVYFSIGVTFNLQFYLFGND